MKKSLCGADCAACGLSANCAGCGRPFGEDCFIARLCENGGDEFARFKGELIRAFKSLEIDGVGEVSELFALKGSFVNLELPLPSGKTAKFWNDDAVYLGNQIKKSDGRCLGLAADATYLMVCEYGENGADAKILAFKKWR